jgi:uncharacterized protein
MAIDLTEMRWLNRPPAAEVRDGALLVRSGEKTDFWQGTYYGFRRDDGHFLYRSRRGDLTAGVTFAGDYRELYDQAGLMIRHDATRWMKCGIEHLDGARHFSVVVTNGHSDWSAFRLDHEFSLMSVQATRKGDALSIYYRTDRMDEWHMARLAYFDPTIEEVAVGPAFCSPQRAGFEARFFDFTLTDPVLQEIG